MSIRTLKLTVHERVLIFKERLLGSPRKVFRTLFIVVLIVALSVGLARYAQKGQSSKETKRYLNMVKATNDAETTASLPKEKQIIQEYLKQPPRNKTYLYDAQVRLAQTCVSLEDYTCANEWGKKAVATDSKSATFGLYESLGDINFQLNNDKDAINYYKKALELLKNDKSPGASARIYSIQGNVSYLESGRKQ